MTPGGDSELPEEGLEDALTPETATTTPDEARLQHLQDLLLALLTVAEQPPAEEPPADGGADDDAAETETAADAETETAAEPETGTAAEPETGTALGQDKETICHKPGTPAEKTKDVPSPAVEGHLGHGDEPGECPEDEAPATGTVTEGD